MQSFPLKNRKNESMMRNSNNDFDEKRRRWRASMKSSTKLTCFKKKKRKGFLDIVNRGGEDSSTRCTPCVPDFDRLSQLVSLDLKVARTEPTSRRDSTYVGHVRRVCSLQPRTEPSKAKPRVLLDDGF